MKTLEKRIEKLEQKHGEPFEGRKWWTMCTEPHETEAEAFSRFKQENPEFQEGDGLINFRHVEPRRPHDNVCD